VGKISPICILKGLPVKSARIPVEKTKIRGGGKALGDSKKNLNSEKSNKRTKEQGKDTT